MKIIVLSSLPRDTGCWLRAFYLARSLGAHAQVKLLPPFPFGLPFMLDIVFTFIFNLITVLFSRADYYIGVKPFPNVTVPLLIIKCLRKKKIVVDIDDVDHLYFTGIPSRVIWLSQRFMPRFFDMVTTHNSLLEEYIICNFRVKRQNMYRLEQGVDTSIFAPCTEKTETDGLAYVAHLNKAADLEPILKAVGIVQQKRDVTFTVIGGGPHEQYFKNLAAASGAKARFTGLLPNHMAAQKIARADICLVYYEQKEVNRYRCSMKLRECLAMGKKIVCNDFGDLKNFEKYTYQSSTSVHDFAQKILEVMCAHDGRELLGQQLIKKHANWDTIGKNCFIKLNNLID
jgi:glycosyltransferase involved in cell wall biosynthesis